MPKCTSIDPLVTPYVDGEIAPGDRQLIDEHLRACPPCHARVVAEQAVRALIHAKKSILSADRASDTLRARCARARLAAHSGSRVAARNWRSRSAPLVMAASLVLIVAGAFVYQLTDRSSQVLAAELTADHLKCFGLNSILGTHDEPAAVERSLASRFGWHVHLPEAVERAGLKLVGARPCLYGEGRAAHIMYRHNGEPISIFMLPRKTRPEEVVAVMGHEAVIWSAGDRTFVLISREPHAEVARVASFVQGTLR
jgi:anti-sigma factor RsiW